MMMTAKRYKRASSPFHKSVNDVKDTWCCREPHFHYMKIISNPSFSNWRTKVSWISIIVRIYGSAAAFGAKRWFFSGKTFSVDKTQTAPRKTIMILFSDCCMCMALKTNRRIVFFFRLFSLDNVVTMSRIWYWLLFYMVTGRLPKRHRRTSTIARIQLIWWLNDLINAL